MTEQTSSKLAELAALSEKAPHTTKMSDKCGFLNDRGEVCGKLYDERRHARYGSQLEYPGYHLFENDWVHDEENCLRCAVRTELKELVGRARLEEAEWWQKLKCHTQKHSPEICICCARIAELEAAIGKPVGKDFIPPSSGQL